MRYDVVILGGGPAGTATALALRQKSDLTIAIIEKSAYDTFRVGETLQPKSRLFLEELGVWNAFARDGHSPSEGTCSCWGSDELHYNDSLCNPYGEGWHLDRRRFDATLAREASDRRIDLYLTTRPLGFAVSAAGRYSITSVNRQKASREMQARFVVDATGRRAVFASFMGARKLIYDALMGVYGFFLPASRNHTIDSFTMIEACEEGWWYSACLPNAHVAVAFMSDRDIIRANTLHQRESWLAHLYKTRQTKMRLSQCTCTEEKPRAYAANSFRLDAICGDGWLAVGDAACAYDPLSGQGLYQALRSSVEAADAVYRSLNGNKTALQEHDRGMTQQFEAYLNTRRYYYGLEHRWPESLFWKRRASRRVGLPQDRVSALVI